MDMRRARQSAFGFIILGLVSTAGGLLEWNTQMAVVLVAVGATFFFGGIVTLTLDSGQYLVTSVHQSIYSDLSENLERLIEAYDLQKTLIYLPRTGSESPVLFLPKHPDHQLPRDIERDSLFVESHNSRAEGIILRPAGATLFSKFESMLEGEMGGTIEELTRQLSDGLIEGFELVDGIRTDVRPEDNVVEFVITGDLHRTGRAHENPVQSFLAVGLAKGLDTPIAVEPIQETENNEALAFRCRGVRDYQLEAI